MIQYDQLLRVTEFNSHVVLTCLKSNISTKKKTNFGTNSVAPELEGSSPHSQQPANDPYPEPGESTSH
jgi:hypothetical protein